MVGLLAGLVVGGLIAALIGLRIGGSDATTVSFGSNSGSGSGSGGQDGTKPPDPATTRNSPAAKGTPVAIGNGWTVTVTGFDPSYTEPDGASAPPAGSRIVVVSIAATYDGAKESQSPFFGMDLSLVGSAGVARSSGNSSCFPPDPQFSSLGDVYKGGTVKGNICVMVDDAEVGSLVLVVAPSMSFDAIKSYLALE